MSKASKKILIVEDELAMKNILADKFEKEGFVVFLAKNGIEGLEIVKKEQPDLILLDIVMPRMDGVTMLKNLRKQKKTGSIPVIILTNLSEPGDVSNGLNGGVKDFLVKTDWSLDEVVKKAQERLK